MRPASFAQAVSRVVTTALALVAAALPLTAAAQTTSGPASDPAFTLDFSNPGLAPAHWTLTIHPDGSGHFTSERAPAPAGQTGELGLPGIDRDITVSQKFAQGIFEVAQKHSWFNQECESHLKVAFQGTKKLAYTGPQGAGSCTFNYSKDKEIQALSDSVIAVALTIQEGAKLEMLLQHDPLGLDKEMGILSNAAREGRAQQLCAISNILQRLAQDDHVMEMVRKQASKLLASDS